MDILLILLALFGHLFLCVAFVNRIHGIAMPHWVIVLLTTMGFAAMPVLPLGLGYWLWNLGLVLPTRSDWLGLPWPVLAYVGICCLGAMWAAAAWTWRCLSAGPPHVLRSDKTHSIGAVPRPLDPDNEDHLDHFLVNLPGNEILSLDVSERALHVEGLDPALEGLSIVHLSDFHFTGRVGKTYFEEVVRISNRFQPDLVAVTGDFVDKSRYIDWIPDTLAKLRSAYGVYFVLGNHDLRVDTARLRRTLVEAGLVDLGGRWIQVMVDGAPVVLAGNQLPWIAPAADMGDAPRSTPHGRPLWILLSHSPDQFEWAQVEGFDLMLAGHTHGGQIRLPWIGPIFAPSRVGVKYACGTFFAPPTILHVTRGVSGKLPVRLNCPPEMAKLTLHVTPRG